MNWVHLRLILLLGGLLTLPGWAALALGHRWRQWMGLQRWVVAVGISIAFYPVFLYGLRTLIPFLTWGPYKMGAFLLACALWIGWRMRRHWREMFTFDRWEVLALVIFGMTLFTRYWIIRDHPYPAWSDSLHHALLTRLTAVQGQLPTSLEPYAPVPLDQYHLGLYALSASVQWLGQVPAHTALLWTAQALNGLCGLGLYLVLDRKVGRVGAVVGALVAGLLSHHPAFYVNWGRFTQVSGQALLLIAWLVTWEAMARWRRSGLEHRVDMLWNTGAAALLSAGVFLLHFRVAIFYAPLLAMSLLWEGWRAWRERGLPRVALGALLVGLVTLLLIAPALGGLARSYIAARSKPIDAPQEEVEETMRLYYEFPWHVVPYLVARPYLLILAGLAALLGLVRRNRLVILSLLWMAVLYLLGEAYLLGIQILNVTNLGAVLIMFYLPLGMIVGSGVQELVELLRPAVRARALPCIATLVFVSGFVASHASVMQIEPYRYFVTPEDVAAMGWIQEYTPGDALFAVNTHFFIPQAPHGTDAGYWIPYFTGRRMTTGTMLLNLAEEEYVTRIVTLSEAVEQLEVDTSSLPTLRQMGVDYIYVGRRGDFSGPGIDPGRLEQAEGVESVYRQGGVSIFRITP